MFFTLQVQIASVLSAHRDKQCKGNNTTGLKTVRPGFKNDYLCAIALLFSKIYIMRILLFFIIIIIF